MQTTALQAATIAHIVNAQPSFKLDCTSLHLRLSNRYAEDSFRVSTLELIPYPTPTRLVLKCTPHAEHVHSGSIFLDSHNRNNFTFQVLNETDENPLLKAVPLVEIFPSDNIFNLSKRVPAGTPYTCSIEETHQLLQIHIPDLKAEVINQFPLTLELWHDLTWPAILTWPALPTEMRYQSSVRVVGPDLDSPRINTGTHRVGTDRFGPNFYILRNNVILAAIFPYLQTLCAWDADVDQPLHGPLSETSFHALLQHGDNGPDLLAYPLLPPTAVLDPTQNYQSLSPANFFPEPSAGKPEHPAHSPWHIAFRIRDAIQEAQARSLQC